MESIRVPKKHKAPDDEQKDEHHEHKHEFKLAKKKELVSTLAILVLAPIIAILLTVFVFQSYQVDGPSMESTLHNNDRLIVTKFPKTWSRITGHDYIPKRYSIVVFNYNGDSSFEVKNKQLIKRVIGLPGDRIVIKDGIVTIYNSQYPQGFYPDKLGPEAGVVGATQGNIDMTLKGDEIFVMGDNRGDSLDSREFGPIESSNIVGNLSVRIFPFDSIKKF